MRLLLVAAMLLLTAGVASADEAPAPLKCLARWYAARPVQVAGRWYAQLPSGERIAYATDPSSPDWTVEDIYSQPYRPGPIVPVTVVDEDPGSIRLDNLFKATYGASEAEVDLVRIDFMGQRVRVHRRVVEAFRKVDKRLRRLIAKQPSLKRFVTGLGGTFNWRSIAGTTELSSHSFGVAIDLNPKLSTYWQWSKLGQWKNRMPQAIVDAFEAEGFIWGGRWYHYDTMHFEYRPELLEASCYPKRSGDGTAPVRHVRR